MIYVYKDRKVRIEWTVMRGASGVREDFSRALLKLFLIGPGEKYLIDVVADHGVVKAEIPPGLPEGSYSVEAIWAKNWNIPETSEPHPRPSCHPFPQDERFNDRCVARSRVDYVFSVTGYQEEQDAPGEGTVVVKLRSATATYGYDGMSAYETAVMHRKFYGTESDWLEWQHNKMIDHFARSINYVYLIYKGTPQLTRNTLPAALRRKGVVVCYEDEAGEVVTERAISSVKLSDDYWGLDSTWERIDELSLSGDISVSPLGTWVINGEDSGITAAGPKGRDGLTPCFKNIDNKLYYSYDDKTWNGCSDYIAAWFRFTDNRIQISRDTTTWTDLTDPFTQDLYIKGYFTAVSELPADAKQGDIYMVGAEAPYAMHVFNDGEWVDNGVFTSIAVGVAQAGGYNDNLVMSQRAVTEKFDEVEAQDVVLSQEEYEALEEKDDGKFYYTYEEEE